MLTAALFIPDPNETPPNGAPVGEWISKVQYVQRAVIYVKARHKNIHTVGLLSYKRQEQIKLSYNI